MKKKEKKPVNREGWKTTKKERINYYIGDIGRTLEGYIVTAFMTEGKLSVEDFQLIKQKE